MLIDEILTAIDIATKESEYTKSVFNDPVYRNREICSLLLNCNGLILFIKYCPTCKRDTIFDARCHCCLPSHYNAKKEYITWDNFFLKEYSFRHDSPYPIFIK